MNMKKKVLGIFCHPDDEVLFGWPIFQSDYYEKHLIILCDDSTRNRPERKQALIEVCKQENINLVGIGYEDNNFYALPTRRVKWTLQHAVENINSILNIAIDAISPYYIFTHNPVGEYGHGSHRLCFELVTQHPLVRNILFTDICQESNHRSSKQIPQSVRKAYYHTLLVEQLVAEKMDVNSLEIKNFYNCKLDINFYNRCKAIYDKHNAWTWNQEPISICNLYYINNRD